MEYLIVVAKSVYLLKQQPNRCFVLKRGKVTLLIGEWWRA
jgi:hypothetical protein